MGNFNTIRNRDAWATIRGFVFQVNTTILRWLSLKEDDFLELECGEDIDIIEDVIKSDDEEHIDRILNQVKLRKKRISLRSPEALASIASFVEHCQSNPKLKLKFLYTTNAQVALEQPSAFEKKTPAIDIWMRIHNGSLQTQQSISASRSIRNFLSIQNKPSKLNKSTWDTLIAFLKNSTDEVFVRTIKNFEWETCCDTQNNLSDCIYQMLVRDDYTKTLETAKELYLKLFHNVFCLLTQQGAKTLDRNQLDKIANQQSIPDEFRDSITRISRLHECLEKQIKNNSKRICKQGKEIELLGKHVNCLLKDVSDIGDLKKAPSIQIPPFIQAGSKRDVTVKKIIGKLNTHSWILIYGGTGMGKTQLAIQVAKQAKKALWIRLNVVDSEEACCRVEQTLEAYSKIDIVPDRQQWIDSICSSLPPNTLIVIDDLPKLSSNSQLAETITLMAQSCHSHKLSLLTTSPHLIKDDILGCMNGNIACCMPVPELTNIEAAEILQAYRAPQKICDQYANFMNEICKQHPTLLSAACNYLKGRQWNFTKQEIEELLGGKYSKSLIHDILSKILDTVPQAQSRDLLDRLMLILHGFGIHEIQIVSEVSPEILRPIDHLLPLLGPWLQQDINDLYLLSPLAKAISPVNMSSRLMKEIKLALGNSIIRQKMDMNDAFDAMLYFYGAEAWDRAGSVFLRMLYNIYRYPETHQYELILAIWATQTQPIPNEMNFDLQLMIRAIQIAIFSNTGHSYKFNIDEMTRLMRYANKDQVPTVFVASLIVGIAIAGKDIQACHDNLARSLKFLPEIHYIDELLASGSIESIQSIVWIAAMNVSTYKHLCSWLNVLTSLPEEMHQNLFNIENADVACIGVTDQIWIKEAEKPITDQNWSEILKALKKLGDTSKKLGLESLWACAVRAQIIVLDDYMDDFLRALSLAKDAQNETQNDCARFIIIDSIARQFVYKKDFAEAREWFSRAYLFKVKKFKSLRIRSLIHSSIALENLNYTEARNKLKEAISIGCNSNSVSKLDIIKAYVELCILHGINNNLYDAFLSLEEAVLLLFESKEDTIDWKSLFMITGHVSGYFTTLSTTGSPPTKALHSESYFAPMRGFTLGYKPEAANFYSEHNYGVMAVQLVQYAESLKLYDKMEYWIDNALDTIQKTKHPLTTLSIGTQAIPLLILRARYADAISLAVDSAVYLEARLNISDPDTFAKSPSFEAKSILGEKPNKKWNTAELNALQTGLFPIMCQLALEKQRNSNTAKKHAQEVISSCLQLNQICSHKQLWAESASLIEKAFISQSPSSTLWKISDNIDQEIYGWLRMIGYVCATCQPDIDIIMACHFHLLVMPEAFDGIRRYSNMTYEKILVPWIIEFWHYYFNKQRFRFSNPNIVEAEFKNIHKYDVQNQAQITLKAVANSLGVKPSQRANSWVQNILMPNE